MMWRAKLGTFCRMLNLKPAACHKGGNQAIDAGWRY
jgi:hypothetical protein